MTSGHVASNTLEAARVGFGAHRLRHAVRGEHDRAAGRNLVELLDEHGAFRLQIVDDELVVHDFVAHVDRRAELRERLLDDGDGAVDAGAEAARIGEDARPSVTPSGRLGADRCAPWRKLSRISSAAPTVIALSATLNAGHDQPRVVEQQEVDHAPDRDAVPEVAERAAQDQREPEAIAACCRRVAAATR